jgi:hypothetical protein
MGDIRAYRVGKRHGLTGVRHLAHRRCRPYDSRSAQESYNHGYSAGAKERREQQNKVGLDYSNPLNNQLFD